MLPAVRVLFLSFAKRKEPKKRPLLFAILFVFLTVLMSRCASFESLRAKKKLYAVDARATQLRGAGFSAYNGLLLNYFKRVSLLFFELTVFLSFLRHKKGPIICSGSVLLSSRIPNSFA